MRNHDNTESIERSEDASRKRQPVFQKDSGVRWGVNGPRDENNGGVYQTVANNETRSHSDNCYQDLGFP